MSRSGLGGGEPNDRRKTCILHVCTSCRPKGFPREPQSDRPGFILYEKLSRLIERRNYDFNLFIGGDHSMSLATISGMINKEDRTNKILREIIVWEHMKTNLIIVNVCV